MQSRKIVLKVLAVLVFIAIVLYVAGSKYEREKLEKKAEQAYRFFWNAVHYNMVDKVCEPFVIGVGD